MAPDTAATIKASMQRIAQVVNDSERKRAEAWLRFARQANEAVRRKPTTWEEGERP